MFGRKKVIKRQPAIILSDENGGILYSGDLTGMAVSDELVIALSVEFFNDPTPCEIHRSAVLARVFLSIEDAFPAGTSVAIDTLEPDIRRFFSAYPNVRNVLLEDSSL